MNFGCVVDLYHDIIGRELVGNVLLQQIAQILCMWWATEMKKNEVLFVFAHKMTHVTDFIWIYISSWNRMFVSVVRSSRQRYSKNGWWRYINTMRRGRYREKRKIQSFFFWQRKSKVQCAITCETVQFCCHSFLDCSEMLNDLPDLNDRRTTAEGKKLKGKKYMAKSWKKNGSHNWQWWICNRASSATSTSTTTTSATQNNDEQTRNYVSEYLCASWSDK